MDNNEYMVVKIKIYVILLLSLVIVGPFSVYASDKQKSIEAVFLYNLSHYVFWPEHRGEVEINICLVGTSYIGPYLKEVQKIDQTKNKILNVFHAENTQSVLNGDYKCHIVYFSKTFLKNNLSEIKSFHNLNALTVSSADQFSETGAVELGSFEGRLKLIINLKMVKEAGLSVSSKLLRLAKVVDR
jgi:hypothetical protein